MVPKLIFKKKNRKKMNPENGLPVYSGPVDHLRYGLASLEHQHNQSHPVARIQKSVMEQEWTSKLDSARRQYGSHMAMRLATEKQMFSQNHRLPGLQSSHISRDILLGTSDSIDFNDFLNDPLTRAEGSKVPLHTLMEHKLGIM